jgi:6-phosphogluconolactonase
VDHTLEVVADVAALAERAADFVHQFTHECVATYGSCQLAVSGGTTPWAMFSALTTRKILWEALTLYQVDERVAPDGDADRNLSHLRASLGDRPVTVVPMDVTATDLDEAAAQYGAALPSRFDLVHLGLGPDGHTASLVPGDPVLDVTDRRVAVTAPYDGHRRMTLTYPGLAPTDQVLWLVSGADKRDALARLLAGDTSIPAGRIASERSHIICDQAAHP